MTYRSRSAAAAATGKVLVPTAAHFATTSRCNRPWSIPSECVVLALELTLSRVECVGEPRARFSPKTVLVLGGDRLERSSGQRPGVAACGGWGGVPLALNTSILALVFLTLGGPLAYSAWFGKFAAVSRENCLSKSLGARVFSSSCLPSTCYGMP